MLKKARSFREKLKKGPLNRASSSTSSFKATLARNLSITGRDKKKGNGEEGRTKPQPVTSRPTTLSEDQNHILLTEPIHPNVEKVLNEKKKVKQALTYINFAIDKRNMILLPGSATVALETTFELITLITGLLAGEEPSAELTFYLTSTYNALAELIEWADQVMLMDTESQIDVTNAKRVIKGIETSVDELTEFAREIVKHLKVATTPTLNTMTLPSKTRQKRAAATTQEDRVKRNSMPEVPLTPREKTILRETKLGAFDNPLASDRLDPTTPTTPTQPVEFDECETAPPKPYLPPGFDLMRTLSRSQSTEPPPDIPSKKRFMLTRSEAMASSSIDSLDGPSSRSSDGGFNTRPRSALIAGHLTKRDDYNEMLDKMGMSYAQSDRSGASSGQLFSSHDSIDGRVGKRSSVISNSSHSSANYSSQTRTLSEASSGRVYLQSGAPLARSEDLSPIQPIISQLAPAGGSTGSPAVDFDDLSSRIDKLAMGLMSGSKGQPSDQPPTLPKKERRSRLGSDYDNVSNGSFDSPTRVMSASDSWTQYGDRSLMNRSYDGLTSVNKWHKQQMSGHAFYGMINHYEQRNESLTVSATPDSLQVSSSHHVVSSSSHSIRQPPPLPPKRKHVESYMHVFGTELDFTEYHPVDSSNSRQFYLHQQEQFNLELFSHHQTMAMGNNFPFIYQSSPQYTPQYMLAEGGAYDDRMHCSAHGVVTGCDSSVPSTGDLSHRSSLVCDDVNDEEEEDEEGDYSEINPLDMTDVRDLLIRDSPGDTTSTGADSGLGSSVITSSGGSSRNSAAPSIQLRRSSKLLAGLKGGSVDALVVYATHVGKHDLLTMGSFLSLSQADIDTDFMYQEAFLTTYRTFVSPDELIDKLLYRYNKFARIKDMSKKRLSRNAFSLLVRVVDELTASELEERISLRLLKLVSELVREGELTLAKIMRRKVLEKCDPNQRPVEDILIVASAPKSPAREITLLDFKSQELAEQLTLLENDFYQRLELPELLIWSTEQNEEKCPNLVEFTEHFNKMSWWCRSAILKPDDPAIREKYFIKFVHTLKHLRKHNNFNSLLALLSALDSAPVSRLDWPRQEREMIQDYSSLIDCTSSFKSYRMALADAQPPCIPYIGLILNDMTIIRVGNTSTLPDDSVNFQMRWQLFNVLECLRRFRKPAYIFKKDPKFLQFLNNFSDHNSNDDEMWERSKVIKPTSTR